MKHNEVKAFFKNALKEELKNKIVLSIDETATSRNIYIIDKTTMTTQFYISTFFGTNKFHVKLFKVTTMMQAGHQELHEFKDHCYEEEGNYLQLHKLKLVIREIKNILKGGKKESCSLFTN